MYGPWIPLPDSLLRVSSEYAVETVLFIDTSTATQGYIPLK